MKEGAQCKLVMSCKKKRFLGFFGGGTKKQLLCVCSTERVQIRNYKRSSSSSIGPRDLFPSHPLFPLFSFLLSAWSMNSGDATCHSIPQKPPLVENKNTRKTKERSSPFRSFILFFEKKSRFNQRWCLNCIPENLRANKLTQNILKKKLYLYLFISTLKDRPWSTGD